jgi:renalase
VTSHSGRPRVAVIGAGIAGLACARELLVRGADVTVYEKSRGPGGRLATRQTDAGSFDHGAQYFTVQNHRFEAVALRLIGARAAARWNGRMVACFGGRSADQTRSVERVVGVPGMNDIGRSLAVGLDLRLNTRIVRLERRRDRWFPRDPTPKALSVRGFDAVCVAVPSAQAAELLAESCQGLAAIAAGVQWEPCWAVMLALRARSAAAFEAAFIHDDAILYWAAQDSAKPGRLKVDGIAERWVLHARGAWSRQHLEMEPAQAAQWLVRSFASRLGRSLEIGFVGAHRWRYAAPVQALTRSYLWDEDLRIGAAGDWCAGARVEDAYLSGVALAQAVLG